MSDEGFKSPFGLPIQTSKSQSDKQPVISEIPITDEAPITEKAKDLDALIKALFSHSRNEPLQKESDLERLQKHFKMILELLKHGS